MIAINGQKAEGIAINGQVVNGIVYGGEVIYKTEGFVQVESLKATPALISGMQVGSIRDITLTFTPDNATDKSIIFDPQFPAGASLVSYDIDTGLVRVKRVTSSGNSLRFRSQSNPDAVGTTAII